MKVSVLIPYYNDREFLRQSIESVLNQTYKDFELILVNHATTDDCREIAHSYNDDRIINLDMDRNYGGGTGLIMEKFLEHASGEYLKLFCADDIMYPDCLRDLVAFASLHPEYDMVFGDVEHIDVNGNSLSNSWFKSRHGFDLKNTEVDCLRNYFKGLSTLPYIGSFVKTEKMKQIEIDVSCIMDFDMHLWTSLLLNGCKIGYLNKYVAGYRIHDNQMCSAKNRKLIFVRGYPELTALAQLYFKINDINLLKNLFKTNPFIKKVDEQDVKFIVAYEMLLSNIKPISYLGYNILYNMIQNKEERKYLEQKFNFGVFEFRKVYSSFLAPNDSTEVYLFILFKRFLKWVSLYKYWQDSNKKII